MSATEETPGVDMSFLSTHPSSKNRTVQVRKWADEVSSTAPPLSLSRLLAHELTGSRILPQLDHPRQALAMWSAPPPDRTVPAGHAVKVVNEIEMMPMKDMPSMLHVESTYSSQVSMLLLYPSLL